MAPYPVPAWLLLLIQRLRAEGYLHEFLSP